jgi:hypothetical protein
MRRIKDLGIVFCIVVAVFACAIVLPCSCEGVRETTTRDVFRWHITDIVLAMHTYHADHHELPPAVVRDKAGKPLYSWRVLLLPYLEQVPLYHKFKLDEPWDSPNNKKLAEQTPSPFHTLEDGLPGLTCFQVIVGPGTAFERPGLTFKDCPDGLSNTILVVEAKEAVPWSKPVDLAYDPNGPLPQFGSRFSIATNRFLHCKYGWRTSFAACFADGSTVFILSDTDEKIIRALITRNGGESEGREDLKR